MSPPAGAQRRPRRIKPADERRADLIDAAEQLFVEHGVAQTSIDQIAAAAGVAKGTFYLYFASKDDIARGVEERFSTTILGRVRQATDNAEGWPARIRTWAATVATAYLDQLALHDALFYGWAPASREASSENVLVDHLTELLTAARDDGAITTDAPATLAAFLFGGVTTAIDHAIVHGDSKDRPAMARTATQLASYVLRGVASE